MIFGMPLVVLIGVLACGTSVVPKGNETLGVMSVPSDTECKHQALRPRSGGELLGAGLLATSTESVSHLQCNGSPGRFAMIHISGIEKPADLSKRFAANAEESGYVYLSDVAASSGTLDGQTAIAERATISVGGMPYERTLRAFTHENDIYIAFVLAHESRFGAKPEHANAFLDSVDFFAIGEPK